jgi:acetyltransferase-like isoleucine patch superfamily enzyme
VFLGPNVVITNDPYPVRTGSGLDPVRLCRGATIGGNATLCPGIVVGEGAFVAAGAIVTRDVPPWHLAIGGPARFRPLPKSLKMRNKIA